MKENIDLSLDIALKLRKVFIYGINKQKQLVLKKDISDELAEVLLINIDTLSSLDILLDELIVLLNERKLIFGNEGIDKEMEVI
jgi:hypothetical protein